MITPLVRLATLSDAPAVLAIYAPYVLESMVTFETIPPTEAEMEGRLATLIDGGYPYLVAEVDGVVAAYAYAGPFHRRAAYRGTVENSVYVGRDVRRHGLGRLLMERLLEEATARGFRQMIAVIAQGEDRTSEAFHRSLGFQEMGRVRSVGWKFGRWLDVAYLQIALGDGDGAPPPESGPACPF
jgi:phosphinothricin acetyltransferase